MMGPARAMTQAYLEKMTRILDELERSSRGRSVSPSAPVVAMAVERDGRRLVNFAGNDYLGLARDPRLAAAAAAGARDGVGAGASPLVCGWSGPCAP